MKGVKEIGVGWGGCGVKGMRVGIEALFYTSGTNIQVEKRVMFQEKRGGPKEHGGVGLRSRHISPIEERKQDNEYRRR